MDRFHIPAHLLRWMCAMCFVTSCRAITTTPITPLSCYTQLMPESLYLTVNLIDRFLEAKPVTRKNLQLVRACSLLCADLLPLAEVLFMSTALVSACLHCVSPTT